MSEQSVDQQINQINCLIGHKMKIIRNHLEDEDKPIVDEIVMKKSHSSDPSYPKYDRRVCYYQEFWKVYLLNQIMISKIKTYSTSNRILAEEIGALDEAEKEWTQIMSQRCKKKVRRTSDMIDKHFTCPFNKCHKTYGSDVSLNLHMKLKHNSGTKTERENLAKEICLAEQRGTKVKCHLNFPPEYLQEFKQNFQREYV